MELDQLGDIDVADAVAVGEHERLGADVLGQALHPAPGLRVRTGIQQMDHPVFAVTAVGRDLAGIQLDGQAARPVVVVEEVVLDLLALVAQGDDEFLVALSGIDAHDVPQDRLAADLDHRLGPDGRLFGEPCSQPAGKDGDLHLHGRSPGSRISRPPTILLALAER